jgi:hypothetical protein
MPKASCGKLATAKNHRFDPGHPKIDVGEQDLSRE